jgi:hypothetical protein
MKQILRGCKKEVLVNCFPKNFIVVEIENFNKLRVRF